MASGQGWKQNFCGCCDQNLNLYIPPFCIEVHRGRFWAQNTCISSLLSSICQFRTFLGPTDQDLGDLGKCRGNIRTLPLMCLDMNLVLFWPIGGSFSKGKYKKYTFCDIQKYTLKIREIQKLGCTIANVVSRGFRGYRTLWGSGCPTLRIIASNLQPELSNFPKR